MILFIIFLFGICVGSFLNVVIDRIPRGKSIVSERSHCDFCKHPLAWYDLIPLVSFFLLGARCRYCHKKLSFQYPLIELLTGCVFVGIFFFENPSTITQFLMVFLDISLAALGIALTIMDIKYHLLSDKLIVAFGILAVVKILLEDPLQLLARIIVALCSGIPLFLLFFFTKGRGMGFGDVKLISILGLFLGFPKILICYYLAFLTGGIVAIILVLGKRKKLHGGTIAFGPFLLLGGLVASVYGDILWKYIRLIVGI